MSSSPGDKFQVAANLLKALSHPLRLELVCGLRHQPCTQTFIADTLGLPQSTVAQHIKVLRSEGLVRADRRGVEVVFSLADPQLMDLLDTLCSKDGQPVYSGYTWDELATMDRERRSNGVR